MKVHEAMTISWDKANSKQILKKKKSSIKMIKYFNELLSEFKQSLSMEILTVGFI